MCNRIFLAAFLMAGLVSVAPAQRGGGPQGGGGFGGDDSAAQYGALAGRPFQAQDRLDRFTSMLKLNKEQKSGAKEIFDAAEKEAATVRDEIQKSRTALASAYMQKQSQAEIDKLAADYGTQMAQMAGIEIRAFSKLVDSLTPDQQKRAGPVFQQMAGMFSGKDWNR